MPEGCCYTESIAGPANLQTVDGRLPGVYEPQGFVQVLPRDGMRPTDALGRPVEYVPEKSETPTPRDEKHFVTREQFAELCANLQEDGHYMAMTQFGAIPIPDEMMKNLPSEFQGSPVEQEEEVFVAKETKVVRTTEKDYTHFDHKFEEIPTRMKIQKFDAKIEKRIVEIPRFIYKPVVEEKIVELPQGVKYVEVPIEIEMQYPPRIDPVPKKIDVERVIQTTKPVVQEKIIEVPKHDVVRIPKDLLWHTFHLPQLTIMLLLFPKLRLLTTFYTCLHIVEMNLKKSTCIQALEKLNFLTKLR
eukprot:GHVP01061864.1.p1 GENE.GHVP01061864.1~~GHVP01061864.1.p1  ORF type:complete len:342 (+),score=59.56 GHVP01061864.1:121-1026(+)